MIDQIMEQENEFHEVKMRSWLLESVVPGLCPQYIVPIHQAQQHNDVIDPFICGGRFVIHCLILSINSFFTRFIKRIVSYQSNIMLY